ncbi:DUF4129 domain-containing protein [Saccharothrix xinjiangensis]|uniref:DUF4129 domain-containing protein n=1 Tax=Saccharothrix xinjiangensis TaxID=204798 RepID=A0ABV9XZS9_9PSEU
MKPRLALALVAGSALVLVALAARGSSPVTYADRGGDVDDAPVTTPPPAPDQEPLADVGGSTTAGSFLVLLLVVVAAAVVGLVVIAVHALGQVRRGRRSRAGREADAPDAVDGRVGAPEILVQRATEALEELRERGGGPPGDAVIAAWLTLERAAEESGLPRQGHQTPTEFTGDLLTRHRVDEAATGALRRAYQRARFGSAEVTRDDARAAAEALEAIVRGLR